MKRGQLDPPTLSRSPSLRESGMRACARLASLCGCGCGSQLTRFESISWRLKKEDAQPTRTKSQHHEQVALINKRSKTKNQLSSIGIVLLWSAPSSSASSFPSSSPSTAPLQLKSKLLLFLLQANQSESCLVHTINKSQANQLE